MCHILITLRTSISPKKATYKKCYWTSSKSSVASIPEANKVGFSTKISTKKTGTATITAKAMDGSGKKAKVKIKVVKFQSDKTPAPTAAPDTRVKTVVEDFESYDAGTTWDKFTAAGKLNADGTSTSGTMTVVTDPENADNKCLQIKYTGPEAYDYAPVFNVDLSKLKDSLGNPTAGKTLANYTGVKLSARVVGTSGDVTYKKIYCYFDQDGKISKNDKFAADANKSGSAHVDSSGNAVAAGAANEDRSLRFGVTIPMAEGDSNKTGGTLFNGQASVEVNQYFPCYYGSWKPEDVSTHYAASSCSVGFKLKEDDGKAGFADRALTFNTGRINEADSTLLKQSKFDMVLGSTYGGSTKNTGGTDLTLYIDDVALVEETVEIQDFSLSVAEGQDVVYPGGNTTVSVAYTPENTTQKELVWTTNNDKVTVDTEGKVSVPEDFELANNETTEVVVTATSKAKSSLSKSITIKVAPIQLPTEAYVVDFDTMYDAELSGDLKPEKTTDADGVECWKFTFTDKNQRVFFKLPEEVNLSAYQKYELVGYSEKQIDFSIFGANLPTDQTTYTSGDDAWWNRRAAGTSPFYNGSCANREADGTWVAPLAVETLSGMLSKIKSTKSYAGDYNKVKYVTIGNGNGSNDQAMEFRIYSLKFTPKPSGTQAKYDFTTVPLSESFENGTSSLLGLENSQITTDAAQEGTSSMEVAADENPTLLFDNREGTEDIKYQLTAYVKAKDTANAGSVKFSGTTTFTDVKYETYEDYEKVQSAQCMSASKDLTSSDDWIKVTGTVTVASGSIGEVSLSRTDDTGFAYYLDSVTVAQK